MNKRFIGNFYVLIFTLVSMANSMAMDAPPTGEEMEVIAPKSSTFDLRLFVVLKQSFQIHLPEDVSDNLIKIMLKLYLQDAMLTGDYVLVGKSRGAAHGAALSPDGRYIVVNDVVVSFDEGEKIHDFGDRPQISCFHLFSPNGKYLISSGYRKFNLWDFENKMLVQSFEIPGNRCVFSTDSSFMAYVKRTDILIVNLKTGSVETIHIGDNIDIHKFSISSDNSLIALSLKHSSTYSDNIELWHIASQTRKMTLPRKGLRGRCELVFSSDTKELFVIEASSVCTWNIETRAEVKSIYLKSTGYELNTPVTFCPKRNLIFLGCDYIGERPNLLEIFNKDSGKKLRDLETQGEPIQNIYFSEDGHKMLTLHSWGSLGIWILKPLLNDVKAQY